MRREIKFRALINQKPAIARNNMRERYELLPDIFHYYKTQEDNIIRINSHFRPSKDKIPKFGTWIVQEQNENENGNWVMPCFPEITWGALSKFEYLGKNIFHKDSNGAG